MAKKENNNHVHDNLTYQCQKEKTEQTKKAMAAWAAKKNVKQEPKEVKIHIISKEDRDTKIVELEQQLAALKADF